MKRVSKMLVAFFVIVCAVVVLTIVYHEKGDISEVQLPIDFESKMQENVFGNTGEIRIMSSNLLADYKSWGGTPVKPRAKKYLDVLDAYKPDVVGVQELCECWFCCVSNNLPNGYRLLNPISTGAFFRMTSMLYNAETLDVVDSGTFAYENGDPRLRRVIWAVFEIKENGKQFAVTNTHFDFLREGQELEYTSVMKGQRDELLNCINE
ncbi:MAG: hypothetical protein K2K01_02145, partial [Eubacterium sp.]|nr:hypothetical protein [Eubacterium sp.]